MSGCPPVCLVNFDMSDHDGIQNKMSWGSVDEKCSSFITLHLCYLQTKTINCFITITLLSFSYPSPPPSSLPPHPPPFTPPPSPLPCPFCLIVAHNCDSTNHWPLTGIKHLSSYRIWSSIKCFFRQSFPGNERWRFPLNFSLQCECFIFFSGFL